MCCLKLCETPIHQTLICFISRKDLTWSEIEKKIEPIKDFLEENKNTKYYKVLYKGIITLDSPLVYKPEILFIGINSGEGAYNECNGGDHSKNEHL